MIGPHHICVLYVATAGLQGPLMGSDEQEIVLLIFVIVDAVQNKVRINYFFAYFPTFQSTPTFPLSLLKPFFSNLIILPFDKTF